MPTDSGMTCRTAVAVVAVTALAIALLGSGCSKQPAPPASPPQSPATPPATSTAVAKPDADTPTDTGLFDTSGPTVKGSAPWSGVMLRGDDPDAIARYLQTVTEIVPTRFKVQWSPATVAFDRAAAIRALREVSQDGHQFTLDPAEPAAAKLHPGSILWIYDVTVSKVDHLERRDGSLIVYTVPVALNEAIPNADIAFEARMPVANFVLDRKAPREPSPVAASWQPRGHIRPALYDTLQPSAPSSEAPSGTPPAPSDAPVTPQEDSFDGQTYNQTLKGFDFKVGYAPGPNDSIRLVIEARNAEDASGSGQGNEEATTVANELKKARAAAQQARDDIKKLHTQLYQAEQGQVSPVVIFGLKQLLGEAAKRLTAAEEARTAAGKARAALTDKFWTIIKDAFDVRFKALVELDGFSAAGHYLFSQGNVQETQLAFKAITGHAKAKIVARLGDKGTKGVKVPIMDVPVEFNVPMPIGGIPFVLQFAADFNLNVFLSGQHASLAAQGEYAFNGNTGLTYHNGTAQADSSMSNEEPSIAKYEGATPGASAFVLGVQLPKIGYGLGLFGASSMAFFDIVHVMSMTSSASAGGLFNDCKRITYLATGRVGIETKVLPIPNEALQNFVKDKLSYKTPVFKKEKVILQPKIKACEIGDSPGGSGV